MKYTLSAVGSTDPFRATGINITYIYTLAGVSGTVVVRAEGSHDGSVWVNLDENGDTSITANGTYGFEKSGVSYSQVRFTWVSGTATSIITTISNN